MAQTEIDVPRSHGPHISTSTGFGRFGEKRELRTYQAHQLEDEVSQKWRAQFIISDEKFVRSLFNNNFQNSWQDAVPVWQQTIEAIQQRDIEKAEQLVRSMYAMFETEITRINMAAIHLEKHNPKSALNVLEYSGDMAKQNWEFYLNKALARMDLKDYQLALMELNNVASLQDSNVKVAFCFAKIYQYLGYYYKAGEYLKLTSKLAPSYSPGWYMLGMIQSKLGELQDAYTSFEQAQKISPNQYSLWYNKGNVLLRLTKYESAVACYKQSLRLNPGYAMAWNNMGIALNYVGRSFEALQSFRKALSFNPRLYEAHLNCGLIFETMGKRQKALEYYHRFLQIAPNNFQKQKEIVNSRIGALQRKNQ